MGEAIARFREVALAIRRHSDESFSYLRWEVVAWAEKSFCTSCRWLLRDFEAGRLAPLTYARELRRERQRAERQVLLTPCGQKQFSVAEWLPPAMQADPPNIKRLTDAAAKESLAWGRLFKVADSRVRALARAAAALGKPYNLAPEEYGKALSRWQAAFDALAPFVGEPPTSAASTSEKKTGGSRGRGGRPQNDEDLARDLLAGWKAFEPEEGRKTKDHYLAQRPDVRVLKTDEARQRKIASLRVALDSALHLQREKTKQKRRARG
jgi:hypothetical protein